MIIKIVDSGKISWWGRSRREKVNLFFPHSIIIKKANIVDFLKKDNLFIFYNTNYYILIYFFCKLFMSDGYKMTFFLHWDFMTESKNKVFRKKKLYRIVHFYILNNSSLVLVPSNWLKNRLQSYWINDTISVINHWYIPIYNRPQKKIQGKIIEFVTTTNFNYEDKYLWVKKLITYLEKLDIKYKLNVIWWWKFLDDFKEINNKKNIKYHWYLTKKWILSIYSISDIFVYNSNLDSWPLVVLEAIDFWLPVITNKIWFVDELFPNCLIYEDYFQFENIYKAVIQWVIDISSIRKEIFYKTGYKSISNVRKNKINSLK
jgi:hypothetical protein